MMNNRIRIGVKTEERRLRHGLMIDWNVHGTKFVGLFFRGRSFLNVMTFHDRSAIIRVGRRAWSNIDGRWGVDRLLNGK